MGVTQTGARLYFTTGCVSRAVRPYTLNLLHVRLPPGYAANAPSHRPAKVHMATYNKGKAIALYKIVSCIITIISLLSYLLRTVNFQATPFLSPQRVENLIPCGALAVTLIHSTLIL